MSLDFVKMIFTIAAKYRIDVKAYMQIRAMAKRSLSRLNATTCELSRSSIKITMIPSRLNRNRKLETKLYRYRNFW